MENLNDLYIITDFDHTLTTKDSPSSTDVIVYNNVFPKAYTKAHEEIDKKFSVYEKDLTIPYKEKYKLMYDWTEESLDLLKEYKITKRQFDDAINYKDSMILRKKVNEFLKFTYDNNIPVIIISAGIENSIKAFLKNNNLLFPNISIISNEIIFENNYIKGTKGKLLHSMNKNEIEYPKEIYEKIKDKKNALIFGDNISDTLMAPQNKEVIKFGFTNSSDEKEIQEYKKSFDYICESPDTFNSPLDKLKVK